MPAYMCYKNNQSYVLMLHDTYMLLARIKMMCYAPVIGWRLHGRTCYGCKGPYFQTNSSKKKILSHGLTFTISLGHMNFVGKPVPFPQISVTFLWCQKGTKLFMPLLEKKNITVSIPNLGQKREKKEKKNRLSTRYLTTVVSHFCHNSIICY